ncbi:MAG: hypothetical protein PHS59_07310 [Paludibacter sp.]|nr:hypothetical protein [Paludibacter sp.]
MKKTLTIFLIAMLIATMNVSSKSNVLPDYKAWHINQNFNGIAALNGQTPILGVTGETLPADWSWNNSNSNYFTNVAGYYFVNSIDTTLFNAFQFRGGGSGGRGGELRFPSTATSEDKDSTVWFVEFDWTSSNAGFNSTGKNAIGLMLSGSNSKNFSDGEKKGDTWYGDSFFLLYAYKPDTVPELRGGPGHLHLVNLDPKGQPSTVNVTDDAGNIIRVDTIPGSFYRPFHALGGSDLARFRRAGATWHEADSMNQSTKLNVRYKDTHQYHLKLKLNFKSQVIEEFTITQLDSTQNSQTLTNIPFLAPNMAGRNSIVPEAERIIKDISRIEGFSLRTTQLGAGGNSNFEYLIDNLEVYVMKPSKGVEDVSINYIDREGNFAKSTRLISAQEVGFKISLETEDKLRFEDENNYYAYDESATHEANASRNANGESLSVVKDSINTLYVVFKKSSKTIGTYIWNGANSTNWSELEDNFKVNGVSPFSYQVGNAVEFSDENIINKEVNINEPIHLNDAPITISAPDYVFGGTGSIIGNDTLYINAPTTIAMNASTLKGGAVVNTNEITLKSLTPLSNLMLKQDNSTVKFDVPSGSLSLNVEGQGGTVNYDAISNNIYSVKTKNVSTLNLLLKTSGAKSSNYWSGSSTSLSRNIQLNVTTDIENSIMPIAFATNLTMLDSTKVHLGDNIRIIRHANEGSGGSDRLKIGELTGSTNSFIEGGYVDGRASGYEIGSLGTDAVYDGSIRPWLSKIIQGAVIDSTTMNRQSDTLVWGRSGMRLDKVGAGKWIVNGTITFPEVTNKSMFNSINVKGGTLELNNKLYFSDYIAKNSVGQDSAVVAPHTIIVNPNSRLILGDSVVAPAINLITLKVDTLGTIECENNFIGAYNFDVLGTFKGGAKLANSFASYDKATVSMNVNNFTEGNYDVIDAQGDITIIGSVLDIKINASEEGQSIQMIKSMSNIDLSFSKVYVNGVDITGVTPETEGARYVWYFDESTNAGTLLSLVRETDVSNPKATKIIKKIDYYDFLGRKISKYSKGLLLKRILYEDNSVEIQKYFIQDK